MLTKEKTIREHRKMWNWLAKHPNETKENYLNKFYPMKVILNECFLCEYIYSHKKSCKQCPLDWNETCISGERLFVQWMCAADGSNCKAAIAKQIANLPERKE